MKCIQEKKPVGASLHKGIKEVLRYHFSPHSNNKFSEDQQQQQQQTLAQVGHLPALEEMGKGVVHQTGSGN